MGVTRAMGFSGFWEEQNEIGINRLTLAFPRELEIPFLADYAGRSLRPLRVGFALSILLYALFGLLDYLLVPEQVRVFWFIRYALVCPFLAGIFLFSYAPRFHRYMQPAVALSWLVAGLGILAMIVLAPPPVRYSYYVGLILVFICGYTFVRARFIYATISGWSIVVLYEIVLLVIHETPLEIIINNNFFFISANILGMAACYLLELYARRDFYLEKKLEEERERVAELNRTLETRIAERTRQITRALSEKEVLLKEVHHRVKNNLQVITSLLRLQCKTLEDAGAVKALEEWKQRIHSMAMIHEDLYHSETFAEIDGRQYVTKLARHLYKTYESHTDDVMLTVDAGSFTISLTEAVPCGLVLNELISNALKYAFRGAPHDNRKLVITARRRGVAVEITVADNGCGLPPDVDPFKAGSLGFRLVKVLVIDQLQGFLKLDRSQGTAITFGFRL
ncbi:sensor histidine kinase [bacterium]|nr:sensor histidine kinase [bacterium]